MLWNVSSFAISQQKLDSILVALDNIIVHKQAYAQPKELNLAMLTEKYRNAHTTEERLAYALDLGSAYFSYQNDSAMYYVQHAEEYAQAIGHEQDYYNARLMRVNILRAMGLFIEASQVLDGISENKIATSERYKYYNQKRMIYNSLRGYAISFKDKDHYEQRSSNYRDSLLQDPYTPRIQKNLVKIEHLFFEKKYEAALKLVMQNYNSMPPDSLDKDPGLLYFYLADIYRQLGNHTNELFYLAKAAIEDIRYASRSYVALRKLAGYLYESDEVMRAFNYMKCHIEDVVASNDRSRLFEAANMFLDINRAFQTKELQQKETITLILILLAAVTLLLIAAIVYVARQYRHMRIVKDNLSKANDALIKTNLKLKDANLIKVEYIRLFMEQHLNYLSKIESYKKKACKIARVEGMQGMLHFVETSLDTQQELDEFYEYFDMTLLNLFPNFIEEFNALLLPEHQIIIDNRRLTPELRIFALIRLGITNSIDIARFFQYSLSTIYTYRTRMRARAKDRDLFEKQIMNIGI